MQHANYCLPRSVKPAQLLAEVCAAKGQNVRQRCQTKWMEMENGDAENCIKVQLHKRR